MSMTQSIRQEHHREAQIAKWTMVTRVELRDLLATLDSFPEANVVNQQRYEAVVHRFIRAVRELRASMKCPMDVEVSS